MNIVLSGPIGLGSLSDEIVLAGVLKPLLAAKHHVTVLSADAAATAEMHAGIEAVHLPTPTSVLSTPAVWKALDSAHFFGLCGAGMISDKGKTPARAWLGQLESARQMKVTTAVIGAGAIEIENRIEQVRVQRLLHHFADGVSVRDDASKAALVECGLNANRVSSIGDPTLALFDQNAFVVPPDVARVPGAPETRPTSTPFRLKAGLRTRVAFFFTDGIPMRQTFGPEPTHAPAPLASGLNAVLKALSAEKIDALVFHDASRQNVKLAESIADGAENATLLTTETPITKLRAEMASCSAALTDTLHGLLFAAVHGVPAVYLAAQTERPALIEKLGLNAFVIEATAGAFESERALELVRNALANSDALRAAMTVSLSALARKEAQNARMVERLVPKRDRHAKGTAE
ncbi:MAG TPA: polysaccharide pyruvyl transferase family protein [Planctomycetota bacterium]|nr:polysaccharide pyruvyl transferase family protein [Planctomycetota bacterium]